MGYAEYRDWVQMYAGATELSTWLLSRDSGLKLSDDLETPTFYQSLAGVTHCELSAKLPAAPPHTGSVPGPDISGPAVPGGVSF